MRLSIMAFNGPLPSKFIVKVTSVSFELIDFKEAVPSIDASDPIALKCILLSSTSVTSLSKVMVLRTKPRATWTFHFALVSVILSTDFTSGIADETKLISVKADLTLARGSSHLITAIPDVNRLRLAERGSHIKRVGKPSASGSG